MLSHSYKLWYNYLRERRKQAKGKCINEPVYEEINNCHERALVFMHKVITMLTSQIFDWNNLYVIRNCWLKLCFHLLRLQMPRIWIDYCQFLVLQCKITRSRRSFDRALRALPVTQHPRIWPLYLRFVRSLPLPETAIRVYRRYLKVLTSKSWQYLPHIQYCLKMPNCVCAALSRECRRLHWVLKVCWPLGWSCCTSRGCCQWWKPCVQRRQI